MLFEEPRVGKARGGRLEENLGATGPARVYSLWAGAAAVWQACCILLCLTQWMRPQCDHNADSKAFQVELIYVYRTKVAHGQVGASSHTCTVLCGLSCYITTCLQNMGQEWETAGQEGLATTILANLLFPSSPLQRLSSQNLFSIHLPWYSLVK